MNYKNTVNLVAGIFLLGFTISVLAKELPLPSHEKGVKKASGKIVHCDFHELGTWGFKFFVGIKLDNANAPYIRHNLASTERKQYEKWCTEKTVVTIRYRARRVELRPEISYWALDIREKGSRPMDN